MAASGAKYGIATSHFYWVGAIPAMIFLAVFMMPFYYGSRARSVPEYLKMRFDERVRALNSIAFAVMTVFASGISMNALAKLLNAKIVGKLDKYGVYRLEFASADATDAALADLQNNSDVLDVDYNYYFDPPPTPQAACRRKHI